MNTRLIAILSALSLSAVAGVPANAEETAAELAWQQPGYVTEVVIVTAPRPNASATATADGVLAWQQPGYVEEVVVVTASRREVLSTARWAEVSPRVLRQPHMGTAAK